NCLFRRSFTSLSRFEGSKIRNMSSATTIPPERTKLTPPELARRWGVAVEKILQWIRTGELRATNFASSLALKRPRWKIDMADALAFEQHRAAVPVAKPEPHALPPRRTRRTADDVVPFF